MSGKEDTPTVPVGASPAEAGKPKPSKVKKLWWALLIIGFLIFYWYVDQSQKDTPQPTARSSPSPSPTESQIQPTIPVFPTEPVVIQTVVTPSGTGPEHFVTPSGNIGCYLDAEGARCDIAEKDWPTPPKPPLCNLDWGQGLMVRDVGAHTVCAGDTVLGGPVTLGYGNSAQRGNFRCDVSEQGVTCTNLASGKGFKLARAAYSFF